MLATLENEAMREAADEIAKQPESSAHGKGEIAKQPQTMQMAVAQKAGTKNGTLVIGNLLNPSCLILSHTQMSFSRVPFLYPDGLKKSQNKPLVHIHVTAANSEVSGAVWNHQLKHSAHTARRAPWFLCCNYRQPQVQVTKFPLHKLIHLLGVPLKRSPLLEGRKPCQQKKKRERESKNGSQSTLLSALALSPPYLACEMRAHCVPLPGSQAHCYRERIGESDCTFCKAPSWAMSFCGFFRHRRGSLIWAALRSPARGLTFSGLNGNYH